MARAYLLHLKAKYGHGVLSTFRMVYLFGTPMEGASLASIARLASSNPQIRVLLPVKVNDFLQLLNATLDDIVNKHQRIYCAPLLFRTGYEERGTVPLGIIVTKQSATHNSGEWVFDDPDRVKGFARNHIDLVKPADRNDPVYQWVKAGLLACKENAELCPVPERVTPYCETMDGAPNPGKEVTLKLHSTAGTLRSAPK